MDNLLKPLLVFGAAFALAGSAATLASADSLQPFEPGSIQLTVDR